MGFAFHPASHACLSASAGGVWLWVRVRKPNGGPFWFASRASPGLSVSGRAHPAAFGLLAAPDGLFQVGCSGWFGLGTFTERVCKRAFRGRSRCVV